MDGGTGRIFVEGCGVCAVNVFVGEQVGQVARVDSGCVFPKKEGGIFERLSAVTVVNRFPRGFISSVRVHDLFYQRPAAL
jgi:hypothetical protein